MRAISVEKETPVVPVWRGRGKGGLILAAQLSFFSAELGKQPEEPTLVGVGEYVRRV
jgi:hypothetical protein